MLKNIINPKQCPEITEYVVAYHEQEKLFAKIESLVAYLDLPRVEVFLQRWKSCIKEEEYFAILARSALLYF